jgi:uncharacterized protein (DUF305 family)
MKLKIKSLVTVLAVFSLAACNNDNTTTSNTTTDTSTSQSTTHANDTTAEMQNMNMHNGPMASMDSMMDRMKSMKMTGDFDIDFANMMIAHHQGAIDMSQQELNSGRDEKMKRMAEKIITAQKEEISQLQDFVKNYKPSGMKHGEAELEKSKSDMETKMRSMQMSGDPDKDFAMMMKEHHAAAVAMSKKQLTHGMSAKLKKMAQKTITDQNREIKEFESWISSKQ